MSILKKLPVSIALLAIMWSLHLVDFPLKPWLALTTAHPGASIIITVLIATWLAPAEWLLGSTYTLTTGLAATAIGVPITLGIAKHWPNSTDFLSPIGFIVGAAGFASAFMPRLWRRRLRISILSLTATYVLYAGALSDVLGITTAALSIAAGQLLAKPAPGTPTVREQRVLIAVCVACVAIGPAFIALDPLAQGPFSDVTRLLWQDSRGIGPVVANLLPLILQLVFCFGLVRGRITAWWLAVLSQVAALALLTYRLSFLPELIPVMLPWLTVLAILLINRRLFPTHENRAYLLRTALLSAGIAACGSVLWILIAQLHAPLPNVLAETPLRFLPTVVALILPHHVIPTSSLAWFFYEWIGNTFWIFVAFRLYRGFSRPTDPANEADLRIARRLLESGTGDHLSFMTLWKSNRYFFHGDSYVAYRVSNGVALTLGTPVGRDISTEFATFASNQGWSVAWYSVNADFAAAHPELKRVHVAEEAVLPCRTEFKGKKFQNVRTARNKATKEGIRTRWTSWAELDLTTIAKITALSEEWVAEKALPEMGFTLGGLEEMKVPGTRLLLAEAQDGTLHGVTSWMPVFENGSIAGYTLDVMRRNEHGFKGVMELLISEALLIAHSEGSTWISLSGAPLAGQAPSPSWLDNLLQRLGNEVEPFYGFHSLAASKKKFQPEEHPWFLCYDDELKLPNIGLATMHAYLPDLKTTDAVKAWISRH
ncbi:DUF2156 domain-containing protein [Corynebacterium sp. KPL2734]|uniref:bifunctional lysylphosphatidylglycerol flippase/synthetase MprF n=1 Tax=Corynebacterium sp. KPL2734 TaxID=3158312 RepID=UPI0032EC18DA